MYLKTLPDKNVLQAEAAIRTWERQVLLSCLDALWADFLQDIGTLQQASQSRAFSQLDPLDEFKLESAELFTRVLGDFKRQAVVNALSGMHLDAFATDYKTMEEDEWESKKTESERSDFEFIIQSLRKGTKQQQQRGEEEQKTLPSSRVPDVGSTNSGASMRGEQIDSGNDDALTALFKKIAVKTAYGDSQASAANNTGTEDDDDTTR